jgi:hypothetical protein
MRSPLLLFLLLQCFLLSAQQDTEGEIRGYITDAVSNDPVFGAVVCVVNLDRCAQTDTNGFYAIKNVPADTYELAVRSTGYVRVSVRSVPVQAEKATEVNVKLTWPSSSEEWPTTPAFSKRTAWTIGITEGALITGSLIGLHQLWYKQYPREAFHTFNDNREWMQMDKVGHLQTAYSVGLISTELWDLTHISHRKATWIGGLTGLSYLTAIEIMDGYSSGWGFSGGDMLANISGSALFISQELTWGEQRIQPKFGFRTSGYAPYRPELLGTSYVEQLIKDYNGQTYWLSVNVASFLPDETRFPQWLNVAFGYGANGMTGGHENPVMTNAQGNTITFSRYRQYYFSFDIDLRKLPVRSRFLRALFTVISFVKVPLPGIELSQNGIRPLIFAF